MPARSAVSRAQIPDRLEPGQAYPLGATPDGLGINFAVFSANATRIELCIFDASGRRELKRLPLPEYTDQVWHGYLPDLHAGLVYGYRAHGPYAPEHGHRFNPHKLLLDPYARRIVGSVHWSDRLWGYRLDSTRSDLSADRRDSAGAMVKAMVVDDTFTWGRDRSPGIPWSDTVVYEAHVRGLTMQRTNVRADLRGTFAALASSDFIEHLLHLGVTALELLPVHAVCDERFLVERGLRNYWGYSTLAYFAPEPRCLASGAPDEMRMAIRRLHAAGIEVILDVVYNHTCEGSGLGPTLSWRGLDNASYYRLVPGDERQYINDTGCGNTLNVSHPRVLQMVMDSLRYWATSFHVDGFRFDLGATLGREGPGFDPGSGFFDAARQDPVLSQLKLISEPWDVGPDGYQLGAHPAGWAEWNDRYRDAARRYWRGDGGQRGDIAARLTGSADLFDHHGRRPWASVNFVTSHDGFTLADLVSYEAKHNEANGEDNRDGHDDNCSANWGAEGPTGDAEIVATRARVQRAMLATLLLAHGTPMLLAGDEFGRTQRGNNNPYCQDNELSWIDWTFAETAAGRALTAFVARLAKLRRTHHSLRAATFFHGRHEVAPGLSDIAWFDERGEPLTVEQWQDAEGRTLALRRAADGTAQHPEVTLLLLNPTATDLEFRLPASDWPWRLLVDSAHPEALPAGIEGDIYLVAAHAAALLLAA